MIHYAETEDIAGLILTIGFEKAIDKLEWSFKTLKYYNFGEIMINMIKLLYEEVSSCCINNGWSTKFFILSRGVRQGCPVSPYLFILCAEIMGESIRENEDIQGIKVSNFRKTCSVKLSQYADDTTSQGEIFKK